MAYKQWDEAETNTYIVKSDNWGNHTLVRKSDNSSLFFQGDDARALDEFLGQSMDEMFDSMSQSLTDNTCVFIDVSVWRKA